MRKKLMFAGLAGALVVGAALMAASPALAARGGGAKGGGKPGGSTPASISLDQADPHLGDWVTFTTSGGKVIELTCYGESIFDVIYIEYKAVGSSFQLGGTDSEWLARGGPADCSALLYNRVSQGPLTGAFFTAQGAR